MIQLLLGAGLGILGLKSYQKLSEDKEYNAKIKKIKKEITDLMKSVTELSTETADKKVKEMNNYLIKEIENDIKTFSKESKSKFSKKISDVKKEDLTSVKTLMNLFYIYIEVLNEFYNS